jgi:predicted kinase
MHRPFVVVSGLPGSGKSTLARLLAPLLNLPVIDKDDILERLFESKGVGDSAWRRALSRESDLLFQQEALASGGALLVSFWRLPGMPPDSGTPTDWLSELSNPLVQLHCYCPPDVAATRFRHRRRHAGHLDDTASEAGIQARIQAIADLGPLEIGHRIDVDTSSEPRLDVLVRDIVKLRPS